MKPIIKCGGCGYIFEKDYGYSLHKCESVVEEDSKLIMEQITDQLTDLVLEKYIAEDILNMKYAMEHKEKMNKICNLFEEMTCVVLNTVSEETIDKCPIQTHLIFHEKIDTDIEVEESIENYVFIFQRNELDQYRYINDVIENRGDSFLNTKEYIELYNELYNITS